MCESITIHHIGCMTAFISFSKRLHNEVFEFSIVFLLEPLSLLGHHPICKQNHIHPVFMFCITFSGSNQPKSNVYESRVIGSMRQHISWNANSACHYLFRISQKLTVFWHSNKQHNVLNKIKLKVNYVIKNKIIFDFT